MFGAFTGAAESHCIAYNCEWRQGFAIGWRSGAKAIAAEDLPGRRRKLPAGHAALGVIGTS
jgi:hypothetical protein